MYEGGGKKNPKTTKKKKADEDRKIRKTSLEAIS